jgi:hypothetical protein
MLGAFQTVGGLLETAQAAGVRKQHRATGTSPNGMALDQVNVDAKEAEFEITRFLRLPKAKRWEVIRYLKRRYYQDDVAVASLEALEAEAAARLERQRQKKQEYTGLCAARSNN